MITHLSRLVLAVTVAQLSGPPPIPTEPAARSVTPSDVPASVGAPTPGEPGCEARLPTVHIARSGETTAVIARTYKLSPASILGANPAIQNRPVRPGDRLAILPGDGILYNPQSKEGFPEVAQRFRVRAEILFEVNGCQMRERLWIPGVLWVAPPRPKPTPKPLPRAVSAPLPPLPIFRLPPPPNLPPVPPPTRLKPRKAAVRP